MAFVNPFGESQTTTQASSGASKFTNPFAGYTPPVQTSTSKVNVPLTFPTPNAGPSLQPSQPNNPIQSTSRSNPVNDLFSKISTTVSSLRQNLDSNPVIHQIGSFLESQGTAPLKGQEVYLGYENNYKVTGDTPKDIANVILGSLPALIPSGGSAAVTGFSKSQAAVTAALQAGAQIVAGQSPAEVLRNLPFGFMGGFKMSEEPLTFTPAELKGEVVSTDLKNTPLGKQLLKTSFEAENQGSNIQISHDPTSNIKTPAGLPVKIDIIESSQLEQSQIKPLPQNPTLIKLTTDAKSPIYSSAESFAQDKFGTGVGSLIGEIDPMKVTARDPLDQGTVNEYKSQIQAGKALDPIMATVKEGVITTTDGSQRITAYQQLGEKAPIIITKYDQPVEGLKTIGDFYRNSTESESPVHQQLKDLRVTKTPDDHILNPIIDQVDAIIKDNESQAITNQTVLTENGNPQNKVTEGGTAETPKGSSQSPTTSLSSQSPENTVSSGRESRGQSVTKSESSNSTTNAGTNGTQRPGQGLKVSKIAKEIDANAVEKKISQGFSELAGYEPKTVKQQAKLSSDLINSSVDDARAIIRGDKPLPKDINPSYFIKAMEEYLNKNPDMEVLRELVKSPLISETSGAAQTLRFAAERDPYSAVSIIKKLEDDRRAVLEKRLGKTLNQATSTTVNEIKTEIKKVSSTKTDWATFVKSIQC